MLTKVIKRLRKIGNSLGLLIPKDMVDFLGWQPDDNIQMTVSEQDKSVLLERKPLPGSSPKPKIFRGGE
jgi:antitoxin component of MazEF toxin-antitoxin module